MRILIFERDHNGHRFTGVRVLLEALYELIEEHDTDLKITLATSATALKSQEYTHQLKCYENRFRTEILPEFKGPVSPLQAARQKLKDWDFLIEGNQYDHIYVPFGDGLVQLLALSNLLTWNRKYSADSETRCETILMRGSFAYSHVSKITSAIARWSTINTRFDRVHLIDPLPYRSLQKKNVQKISHIKLLPDPITPTPKFNKTEARNKLDLDTKSSWIGCIGRIDSRKGADRLIRAFLDSDLGQNVKLLLAGIHDDGIKPILNTAQDERIVSIDRYLDEDELCFAVSALDLIALPYPDFVGSVSMVLRAVEAERPCLGSDSGWMGYVIPEFNLGTVCDVKNPQVLARTLEHALPSAHAYRATDKARKFSKYESKENVNAHWTAYLRERLNLPQHPSMTSWPSDQ